MATVIKSELRSNASDVVVERGVDISGGLPTMDTAVMVVIDDEAAKSAEEVTILRNIAKKMTYSNS